MVGQRPTLVGQRVSTDLLNSAEFGGSKENESCSGGYPELIYSVGGDGLGHRPKWWGGGPPLIFDL